jgi:hypothetical protein
MEIPMSLKGLTQPEKRIVLILLGVSLIIALGACVILVLSGVPPLILILVAVGEIAGAGFLFTVVPIAFRKAREAKAKRQAELSDLAATLGLEINPRHEEFHTAHLAEFHLFKQGSVAGIKSILSGTKKQVDIALIDFIFTTGSGENRSTHRQSVIYLASPHLDLPPFLLRPEHFFDRIGAALGFNDIDFPENPDFSKRYLLKGKEEIQVRAAFTNDVLTYFETKKTINVEAANSHLIVYRHNQQLEPGPYMDLLREGTEILELFSRN